MASYNEYDLVNDLLTWFDSGLDSQAIVTYVKGIPDDQLDTLDEAQILLLPSIHRQKELYLDGHQLSTFRQELDEFQQLEAIRLFASYSQQSVIDRLKAQYPSLANLTFPSTITTWAGQYVRRWDGACHFISAQLFIQVSVYAVSFLNSDMDQATILAIRQEIVDAHTQDGKRFENFETVNLQEEEKLRSTLQKLKFLPPEVIDRIVKPEGEVERFILFSDILRVLTLFGMVSIDQARSNQARFFDVLADMLAQEVEEGFLVEREAVRLGEVAPVGREQEIFSMLSQIWNINEIRAGNPHERTVAYLNTLQTRAERTLFLDCLEVFFSNDPVSQTILGEVEAVMVTSRAMEVRSYADFTTIQDRLATTPLDEKQQALLARYLKEMFLTIQAAKSTIQLKA